MLVRVLLSAGPCVYERVRDISVRELGFVFVHIRVLYERVRDVSVRALVSLRAMRIHEYVSAYV